MISDLLRRSITLVPWRYRTAIKRWPLIRTVQRRIINSFTGRSEFLHTVDAGPARGLKCRIRLPADKSIWTGTYEHDFAQALRTSVRHGDICFDIGGFRGFFSGVFALAGAREVHIFEPYPNNAKAIENLIKDNETLPLTLHPFALGEDCGQIEFRVMPQASMGKLHSSKFQPEVEPSQVISVEVDTLDHLISTGTIPAPNVIKVDVEGVEAMVIRGSKHTLERLSPVLFIEIHSRELAKECHELLSALNYFVHVLETNAPANFVTEPEICHFIGRRE